MARSRVLAQEATRQAGPSEFSEETYGRPIVVVKEGREKQRRGRRRHATAMRGELGEGWWMERGDVVFGREAR